VVDLARLARLDNEGDLRSLLVADEVVVDATGGDERRERDTVGSDVAIGEDDHTDAVRDGLAGLLADAVEGGLVAGEALFLSKGDVDDARGPIGVDVAEALQRVGLLDRQNRGGEEESVALISLHGE
jgi:hypothetical protein